MRGRMEVERGGKGREVDGRGVGYVWGELSMYG